MSRKRPTPSIRQQNAAIDDLRERYAKALDILCELQLPCWERVHRAMPCYAGVRLDLLPPVWQKRIDLTFRRVNAILANYPIKTVEDYQQISAEDLELLKEIMISLPTAR